jgi:hypothetical protein
MTSHSDLTCLYYRSGADNRTTWVLFQCGKDPQISESSFLFPHPNVDQSGSIFSKATACSEINLVKGVLVEFAPIAGLE